MGDAIGGESECFVYSNYIADGKDDALFFKGKCNGWMHQYCAGVPLKHFERLTLMSSPFLCYTCALQTHERETVELKVKVKLLAEELEGLHKYLRDREVANKASATNVEFCSRAPETIAQGTEGLLWKESLIRQVMCAGSGES